MPSLSEIRERFRGDRFATEAAGAVVDEAEPGRAVCSMRLEGRHMNANKAPMGGAVFTLADLAFAVAANGFAEKITVSQHSSITFLAASRGSTLTAEAVCVASDGTNCLYRVEVRDDLGKHIASVTVNGFTVG